MYATSAIDFAWPVLINTTILALLAPILSTSGSNTPTGAITTAKRVCIRLVEPKESSLMPHTGLILTGGALPAILAANTAPPLLPPATSARTTTTCSMIRLNVWHSIPAPSARPPAAEGPLLMGVIRSTNIAGPATVQFSSTSRCPGLAATTTHQRLISMCSSQKMKLWTMATTGTFLPLTQEPPIHPCSHLFQTWILSTESWPISANYVISGAWNAQVLPISSAQCAWITTSSGPTTRCANPTAPPANSSRTSALPILTTRLPVQTAMWNVYHVLVSTTTAPNAWCSPTPTTLSTTLLWPSMLLATLPVQLRPILCKIRGITAALVVWYATHVLEGVLIAISTILLPTMPPCSLSYVVMISSVEMELFALLACRDILWLEGLVWIRLPVDCIHTMCRAILQQPGRLRIANVWMGNISAAVPVAVLVTWVVWLAVERLQVIVWVVLRGMSYQERLVLIVRSRGRTIGTRLVEITDMWILTTTIISIVDL